MTLSANNMADRIDAYIAAVPVSQVAGAGSISSYRHAVLVAMCHGIIDEITSAAVVHTVDNHGDVCNNGTIT